MHSIKEITILFMMLCAVDTSCRSGDYEYQVPMHVVRSSHHNKPELDTKTLVAFALLGFGSGALCGRLEPSCNPVLQILYLYLWGRVEKDCIGHALYELQQQGIAVSPTMTEHLFWVASWMGYFTSLADR